MHEPMQEGLESYLEGNRDEGFLRRMEESKQLRETVEQFEMDCQVIRSLRAEPVEPPAGFYGRVIDRIEAQKSTSIWSVFLEPIFGSRLMYATAALTIVLGVLLFTSPKEIEMASVPEEILQESIPATQLVDLEDDRNTVFVQLTTFQE